MNMVMIVGAGQTIYDVVLMATGTLESLMEIMAANDLSVSDEVTVGQVVRIPTFDKLKATSVDSGVLGAMASGGVVLGTKGL